MKTPLHTALAIGLAASLSAGCGGGDDGPRYDSAAAWQNLLTASATWTATGTGSDGFDYRFDLNSTPLAAGTYPHSGEASSRTARNDVITIDSFITLETGEQIPFQSRGTREQIWYFTDPGRLIGQSYQPSASCLDVVTRLPLPIAARVGDSGPLYDGVSFSCVLGSPPDLRVVASWSIEKEADTVYFCVNRVHLNEADVPPALSESRDSECFQIDLDGRLGTRVRLSTTTPSLTLVARGG